MQFDAIQITNLITISATRAQSSVPPLIAWIATRTRTQTVEAAVLIACVCVCAPMMYGASNYAEISETLNVLGGYADLLTCSGVKTVQ